MTPFYPVPNPSQPVTPRSSTRYLDSYKPLNIIDGGKLSPSPLNKYWTISIKKKYPYSRTRIMEVLRKQVDERRYVPSIEKLPGKAKVP